MLYNRFLPVIFLGLIFCIKTSAQVEKSKQFIPPLNIPLYLSGTFAELRSSHFHAGIDIKTQQKTGFPVIAVKNGYVSRVKIQSGGYGKTLYITHPDNYTTVYAHLESFEPELNNYVKDYQYSVQQHEINIFPPKNLFSFKQGDTIAFSGNTGRSGGPHLHFEIRKTANQLPVNGLLYGFPVADTISPKLYNLALYDMEQPYPKNPKNIVALHRQSEKVKLPDTLYVANKFGVGLESYDFTNLSANPCGIYQIEMLVDGQKHFECRFDAVPFSETRYILSFTDYSEKILSGKKIQKLFIDPNNHLSIYKGVKNNGHIQLKPGKSANIEIIVKDAYLNQSSLSFIVKAAKTPEVTAPKQDMELQPVKTFQYNESNTYSGENFSVYIPKGALYDNIPFLYKVTTDSVNPWADIHWVHKNTTPLHKNISIGIKPKKPIPEKLLNKAAVCLIDELDTLSVSTTLDDGYLYGKTRDFGAYTIKIDTVPPKIAPVGISQNKLLVKNNRLSFVVSDNLSGIGTYAGFINNQWVLFEFDAKNDMLTYEIDTNRLKKADTYNLKLMVTDGMGNTSTWESSFDL